jgi:hypothetical protein
MSYPLPVARFAIGCDIGQSPDPTAISVLRLNRFHFDFESNRPTTEIDWSPYFSNAPNEAYVYDVIAQEVHYNLAPHLLAERLKELTSSPLYSTPAQLTKTWDGVAQYVVEDITLPPFLGIDATGAGFGTYSDMLRFGIKARGYHLTSGFEPTPGKRGIKNIPALDLFSLMVSNYQRGWIRVGRDVPYADRLREELLSFRWKRTKTTNQLKLEHDREDDHDDLICALACAIQSVSDEINLWKRRAWSGIA